MLPASCRGVETEWQRRSCLLSDPFAPHSQPQKHQAQYVIAFANRGRPAPQELFAEYDVDDSGAISFEELAAGLQKQGYTVNESEVRGAPLRRRPRRAGQAARLGGSWSASTVERPSMAPLEQTHAHCPHPPNRRPPGAPADEPPGHGQHGPRGRRRVCGCTHRLGAGGRPPPDKPQAGCGAVLYSANLGLHLRSRPQKQILLPLYHRPPTARRQTMRRPNGRSMWTPRECVSASHSQQSIAHQPPPPAN